VQSSDLRAVTSLFSSTPEARLALIRAIWPQVVGEQVARQAEVASLTAGLLRLRVVDAQWRRVLPRMRQDMLAHLRQAVGRLAPQQIGLIEGRTRSETHQTSGGPPSAEADRHDPETEPPDTTSPPDALVEASRAIADAALRTEFLAAATRYLNAVVRRASARAGS
jgi:hypothetical protein